MTVACLPCLTVLFEVGFTSALNASLEALVTTASAALRPPEVSAFDAYPDFYGPGAAAVSDIGRRPSIRSFPFQLAACSGLPQDS